MSGCSKFVAQTLWLKLLFFFIGAGLLGLFASRIPEVQWDHREEDLAKRDSYLGQGIKDMYAMVFSQVTRRTAA